MSATQDMQHDALWQEVHENLITTIIDVVGQEFYEECNVTLDSTFAEDIELESMEMMEIADKMIQKYDGKVDFVAWFANMELDEIIELTVGQVVDFITKSLEDFESSGRVPVPTIAEALMAMAPPAPADGDAAVANGNGNGIATNGNGALAEGEAGAGA